MRTRTACRLLALTILVVLTAISSSCDLLGGGPSGDTTSTTATTSPVAPVSSTTSTTIEGSVVVPKLVGRFFFHGKRILEIYGLQYENLSKGLKGTNSRRIAKQDPKAGTEVPEGYVVSLTLMPAPPKGGRKLNDLGAATDGILPSSSTSDSSDGGSDTTAGDDETTTTEGDGTDTTSGGKTTTTDGTEPPPAKSATLTVVDEVRHPRSVGAYDARSDFKIKNTGNATAYCPTVEVNYYLIDASGVRQEARTTQRVAPSVIKPGAHGYVSVNVGDANQDDELEASVSSVGNAASCTAQSLTVDSKSIVTTPEGNPAVSGTISGASGTLFTLAYVGTAAFDTNDDLLEVAMVEVDPLLVALGSTSYLIDLEYAEDVSYVKTFAEGVR